MGVRPPLVILLLWLHHVCLREVTTDTVYFDKYGHCERTDPFDLADEDYTLKPVGGGFAHETMICTIRFKAPSKFGVCLTFEEFDIKDCNVKLKIYRTSTASGTPWRVLDCYDSKPSQMCTSERHVTVQVAKDKLNSNQGYTFEIEVEKSNSVSEEGVLIASIGVFVGIIVGVVVLIAILSFTILYCCFKRRDHRKKKDNSSTVEEETLVEPSAPPPEPNLYPQLPHAYPNHSPPPYVPDAPPPPYEMDTQQTYNTDQTLPMKL